VLFKLSVEYVMLLVIDEAYAMVGPIIGGVGSGFGGHDKATDCVGHEVTNCSGGI